MLTINKITSSPVVDYAAEELKKYLRMMMPEGGDVRIAYEPGARDGFRLGLMQDFGLDVSDAEEPELDDILYIDTDTSGGIIAGDNPRSVLLSVYEYLRQNGCRWLYPGIDGEYIPMKDIVPVKYRHKPSCRYRGQCNEGAESQQCMIETIDFTPKVGMNVYMLEFRVPTDYYAKYYEHKHNQQNRAPEPISNETVLQWKRQCEAEIAKRGLQFHDIGHGWTVDPFGVDSSSNWDVVDDSTVSDESRQYLAEINGRRALYHGQPVNTQFCMSNPKARKMFAEYVADYAENHSNADYLHVWLADAYNNHCECRECHKKTASDWYMILMNEIDAELTKKKLETRIVFIVYLDTTWKPLEEKINNPKRFTLLLAPITRSYAATLSKDGIPTELPKYERNKLTMPSGLEEYFAHFLTWKDIWKGANLSYEYHFWRHQCFDISGLSIANRINEDIKAYKEFDVNGIIEDGSQRSFFPNGFAFYTYARTLFDTSLSTEEIAEDYFSHAYGEGWKKFYAYLKRLSDALPFEYLSNNESAKREFGYYDPERAERIASIRDITKDGRALIKEYYNSPYRVQTVSVRLLEAHADYCDMLADAMAERARGNDEKARELFEHLKIEFGKREIAIERYYDHCLYSGSLGTAFKNDTKKPILLV